MAREPALLLSLWGLALLHGAACFCNVSCSTDYQEWLVCSCSASAPGHLVQLEVVCWDEGQNVSGRCDIQPPRSCSMHLEELYDIASIGTVCRTTATTATVCPPTSCAAETSRWDLSDVVKPPPPFNVRVSDTEDFYNISWKNNNSEDCLVYRLHIRASGDFLKDRDRDRDLVRSPVVTEKYFVLQRRDLLPHTGYVVDVQARMCPTYHLTGPWSDRSPAVEWRMAGQDDGLDRLWLYGALTGAGVVAALLMLGYKKRPCWQRKLNVITYIPKPDYFFKPLYHNHGGNFKEWVKPAFSEYDYLESVSAAPTRSEKRHDVLGYTEDGDVRRGGPFLRPPPFFHDGSPGTARSAGHVSIHTVILSGEEFEEDATSRSSVDDLRGCRDDNGERAAYDAEEPRVSRMEVSPRHENQIHNDLLVEDVNFEPRLVQFDEPERISLDSFVSNEQSEDGYPPVDLDTIDSGFGECSSPGASDSNTAERLDADLFHEHKNCNSNYVRQWMIHSTIREDSGNLESEIQETQ
ncbi:interleukin 21 receptor, tandem duplicate 1 [Brachyistius frenatus]|uniref:interleukin 21 receptor, tandem duplicate 1 n=1 Tax=Brachyistius frenatus TaxID=100188 RepID=UPI0037E982B9